MPPPLGSTPSGESDRPAPLSPPATAPTHDRQRTGLRVLSAVAIGLFLLLSIGLLMTQREAALDMAQAQAQRETSRLAAKFQESLRVARASMEVVHHSPTLGSTQPLGDHAPLAQSLTLPFSLHPLPPAGADLPVGQWRPALAHQDADLWVIPLVWRQPPELGGRSFEVRISRQALLDRFAAEGMPPGGSMSLFRIEDDGATTVLARHPLVPSEQGLTLRGHVATALQRHPSGVLHVVSQIDGVPRIVGYQRLTEGAERLAMVYALPVKGVLAAWAAQLPVAIALIALVAAAMAYGAWRLDRALLQLRRSERHFQTLSDHLPDAVLRCDRSGRVLFVNPAMEQATGTASQAMLGHRFEPFGTTPETARQWEATLARVFATGTPETVCASHPGPHGVREWETRVSREPVLAGEAPTVLVISRDITERREAETRRLAAQQLFETVFQAAPEAMSLADWDSGRLLLVNDAFCTLLDRPREQLIDRTLPAELGPWPSPEHRQRLLTALNNGEQVRDRQGLSTRPNGQDIHVRYSAEKVTLDGQTRLLLMFRDVTQLERDQRVLARSELRFRLAAAQGQVWEWDVDRGFAEASDTFFTNLGHPAPPQDQMGPRFLALIHPEDLPRLRLALRRFFKGEADYQLEFRARDAQGRYHWFDARGSGLRDDSGRVTYMAGTTLDISDRKALEEAQRQTLNRLETLTNASAALLWTSGTDQGCNWVNQRWLDFTGQTLAEVLGEGWASAVHPDDLAKLTRTYEQAFENRAAYSNEFRLRQENGEYRWLLEHSAPSYDADNRFIGYICSCLDVTDFKRAEATAQERGAVLEQVFDVLQDMLFVVDEQERFVHFQTGRSDRLYAPPEVFMGRTVAEVMPPELVQLQRQAMARARHHGMQEIDYNLDLPGGKRSFNARLAWMPGGSQCMFLVRDVTERQATLRERERLNQFVLLLFRLANRFINLPVHEADSAINEALGDMGRFVDADRAYLFDYDFVTNTASNTHEWCGEGVAPAIDDLQNLPLDMLPEWIDQHRLGRVMHVPDVQALPAGRLRDLLSSQGIQSLMALPLMDGDRCLAFVGLDSVRAIHNYGTEETTLLRLFSQMLLNIRLRVAAEEKIQALTEGLEQKVEERTQQLHHSVQRLQTVNRELESFTYSASHDLRTPLRGIEGFSSLLLEDHAAQLDDQGREYLRRIQKATLHMSQLVNDLLAYSRLQQLTEQTEPVALADCAREVVAPFRDELEARQGRIDLHIPEALRVSANAKGLTIALRNLLDNALKFTPAGQAPRIRIEAQAQGDRARLSVIDQGIGFDMRHHDRIFGMFQRLHRQDQIPGTGIGLALVQKALDRMGGHIRAESAPGQGAAFHIDLPLA